MNRNRGRPAGPATIGSVRIIGGRWRGTRLPVPASDGLRPTSDRVRETLFNWLAPVLPGARCLDLFAGTGALGLEAASRGAASVLLVERDASLAAGLQASIERLRAASTVQLRRGNAIDLLAGDLGGPFDLVFLDPPFGAPQWGEIFTRLPHHLGEHARIYVEAPLGAAPATPPDWLLHREGQTREVRYALHARAGTVPR
jgi:16S rRNA (guanine966-N2)-methyltransferase